MNTLTPYLVDEETNSKGNLLELPHNIEAEQQLLGALIRNNDLIEKCNNTKLSGEHFYNKLHGEVYDKINKSLSTGKTANIIFLKTFFENDEEFNSEEYFEQLVINAAPGPAIEEYSSLIYDLALRRKLIGTAEFLQHSSFDLSQDDMSANDIIEETENKLFQIEVSGDSEKGFKSFESTLTESLTTIESAYQSSGGLAGLSTGFNDLDKALGGLQKSDLIILAGRPAMGKTALATNIGFNVAKKFSETLQSDDVKTDKNGNIISDGGVVAFFSLEMSAEQLTTRIAAEQSGIESNELRRGNIKEDQFMHYARTVSDLKSVPFYIDQSGSIPIGVLSTRARRLARTLKTSKNQDLGLIIVDYIQLAATSSGKYRDSRVQEVAEITQGLKSLAKDLDIPIIALSQLSRQVEARDDKRPLLSDLRESGAIEQDADIVMFVYRDEYYLQNNQPPPGTEQHTSWLARMDEVHGKAEVLIRKHRHGPTSNVQLQFEERLTKFSDLARENYLPERFD
mgnify:FL=1|tara:strand:+ start:6724 stop:8256 length:1533 start_codon:yes stop_codon:yes gene_type:complete